MKLLGEQKQRPRHREQTYGYQGGRGHEINWETGIDVYTLLILCIKEITYYIAQGTLINAL